jgi:2-keto-4-pentenoate hydratase/2-oxohepta-3-ene-1,7-dioic acid hydratase in catechol pathway
MRRALGLPRFPDVERIPRMYQGASDDLLGAHDDIPVLDEASGIDFEGEFGVVVDDVPMGCPASRAGDRVRLVVQINDVSLRALAPREMRTGFGFLQAKPSSSFAPVAVTPDELGDAWRDARVHLPLRVELNGRWFGEPDGGAMHFGFDDLVAHAAATRRLTAGTIIGSGTVSNGGGDRGSACIAERRAIEQVETGAPATPFMRFGDRVCMEAPGVRRDRPAGRAGGRCLTERVQPDRRPCAAGAAASRSAARNPSTVGDTVSSCHATTSSTRSSGAVRGRITIPGNDAPRAESGARVTPPPAAT